MINELSQGPSGNKEYVELVVAWTPTCVSTTPCMDLRNYYIDDNNGTFGAGAGTGIATGCVRFKNDPFWSCIPVGTIILIYNDADPNPSVPSLDLSINDGNCRLVIPISNCTLFETSTSSPSTTTSTYPSTGFVSCGSWFNISMANGGDSFQTRDPGGNLLHAISWGNNNLNNIVYLSAASQAGQTALFTNSSNNNFNSALNWSAGPVIGNESPGLPNSPQNASWINLMSNSCQPITPLSVTIQQINDAACGCNGSAIISATGSLPGYNYQWFPSPPVGQGTATASGLCAGSSYKCVITSAIGCKDSVIFIMSGSSAISGTVSGSSISCYGGNNGTAAVSLTGGNGFVNYSWNPSPATGQGSSVVSGLSAQTYTITISDIAGCTTSLTYTPNQASQITSTVNAFPASCFGGTNGSASVIALGGTGNFNFLWMPSGSNLQSPQNLSAGIYTVVVTDANGCVTTDTATISEPTPITFSVSTQAAACGGTGGSASVQVAGGTPGYNFVWSTGITSTSTLNSLTSGSYTCYITDANSCIDSVVAIVGSISGPSITISSVINPTCFGYSDGQIVSSIIGGVAPFTFSWLPLGGNSNTAIGLSAGSYTVSVTDANGCPNFTVANIFNPTPLTLTVNTSSALCNGDSTGFATAIVSGGQPSYNFQWSNSSSNLANLNNIPAGSYTVSVNDTNNCMATSTFIISEPAPINVIVTTTPAYCGNANGTASLSITGGVIPYSYVWSNSFSLSDSIFNQPSGNFSVVVTDSNNCSTNQPFSISSGPSANVTLLAITDASCFGFSNGSVSVSAAGTPPYSYIWLPSVGTLSTANNLSAGTYTCILTDANNCTDSVIASIAQPAQLTATTNSNNVLCYGSSSGAAIVSATGGTGNLTFSWSPSGGNNSTASGLSAGNYTCTISDSNNCIITSSVTITQPPQINISLNSTQINCLNSNASITSNVSGGTPNYNYSWAPSGIGPNLTVQSSGTYSLLVTDANGCSATQTVTVLSDLAAPVVNAGQDDTLSCLPNSSLFLNGSSNTTSTIFQWSGPNGFTSTAASPVISIPGVYTFSVTNTQNGCSGIDSVLVIQQSGPAASFSFNPSSGVAPLNVSFLNGSVGGSGYFWNFGNGETSNFLSDSAIYVISGQYTVTLFVTNAQGCTDSVSQILIIEEETVLNIPNIFTPNQDGKNDIFFIENKGISSLNVLIYNRWGTLIHEIDNIAGFWDGKTSAGDALDGTYFFLLKAKSTAGKEIEKTGYLLLSR